MIVAEIGRRVPTKLWHGGRRVSKGVLVSQVREWLDDRRKDAAVSPKIAVVLDLIADQPRLASFASAAELATKGRVNTATVVRAAQALGFEGWLALRAEVRTRYLASLTAPEISAEHATRSEVATVAALRQDAANLAFLLRNPDADLIEGFARAIAEADRTAVVAAGSYAGLGVPLAHLATVMGFSVTMEARDGSQLANAVGLLGPSSCLVAISFWRIHVETLLAARAAKARGAAVCVITDTASSPLTELATHVITVPSEGASWFPSLTAGLAAVNAVLTALAQLGGSKAEAAVAGMEQLWRDLDLHHRP
jgi:DNA-binding MurR/RpiR family transcriptional regulator